MEEMATNNKYDRQLRLWGAQGQQALAETTVVLVRATAVGTETLKNLVLPGVGKILVLDDVSVRQGDAESNFFVTASPSETKPRAQIAMELLQELNPDVDASYRHVPSLMDLDYTQVLTGVTNPMVVAADLEYPLLMHLSKICANKVPLIAVVSYGLIGLVRLQSPPVPIVQPKPDNATPDLRLVRPFTNLESHLESIDLDQLSDHDHGHIPYPVLLHVIAKQYKCDHNGSLPKTMAEKQEFRQRIKEASRNFDMQLNFQEAVDNAYLAYTVKSVDRSHIEALLQSCPSSTEATRKFATLLRALLKFMTVHDNQVPLQGSLPDMTASTQQYVALQELYRQEAQTHVRELQSYCDTSISEPDVQIFCQNVTTLDLVFFRTLEQAYQRPCPTHIVEDLQAATCDAYEVPIQTPLLWYCGIRACHFFFDKEGRYPGVAENWQDDIPTLQHCIQQVFKDLQLDSTELVQSLQPAGALAREFARYANAEVHTIASLVGGVASQEAVKLIAGQYVPLNNTYIYNGVASVGGVYEF
jgi:amyloid beta precursor protein binding protein 1